MKKRKKWTRVLLYATLIFMSILFIFPFYWAIISGLKSTPELYQYPPTFFPHDIIWQNIVDAWTAMPFTRYFLNSVFVTTFSVIGMTFSSAIIAYGFARFDFKFKNIMFACLLATMMVPWDVLVIPLYMEYSFFGWIDTFKPLIVPAFFGGAFYIFLLRQFLMNIPRDFEEAAYLEGANDFQIFWQIFIPILKPQLALVAVLYMIIVWNDYLGPLVYLNSPDKLTMAIGLSLFKGANTMDVTSTLIIAVIMTIPPMIAFMTMQKRILETDISSGIK